MQWLLELLRDEPGDFDVGDHGTPDFDGLPAYPFWICWSIPGGDVTGPPLGASTADAVFVFQLDSIGQTREQAGRLATRGRERICGRTVAGRYTADKAAPSGIVIVDRSLDGAVGAPAPQGDRPNVVWTSSERYAVVVTAET